MIYHSHLIKLLLNTEDHLFRIKEAEQITNIIKLLFLLTGLSIVVFGWSAWLGIGSAPLSPQALASDPIEYELSKVWFFVGRLLYGLLFALFILFIPSLIFFAAYQISYQKLLVIQLVVLLALIVERVLWIPLFVYAGLDWQVSPLSFGVLASYITDIPFLIYFFGAVSLFQLWIIFFQVRCISYLSSVRLRWVWTGVLLLHLAYWISAAIFSTDGMYLVELITERGK
ncbi:hypothetical protein [Virgibacillus senegalensis]|uniref:hypothetical protein n=1 Tax=Virgibacillus senegalensis TaxID=1499679 RepID=UPI00069E45F2|nr:hypothetical protein [Virgibacillus senegalensis]